MKVALSIDLDGNFRIGLISLKLFHFKTPGPKNDNTIDLLRPSWLGIIIVGSTCASPKMFNVYNENTTSTLPRQIIGLVHGDTRTSSRTESRATPLCREGHVVLTSSVSAPPTMLRPSPDLPFWISIVVSRPGTMGHMAGSVVTSGSFSFSGSRMDGGGGEAAAGSAGAGSETTGREKSMI